MHKKKKTGHEIRIRVAKMTHSCMRLEKCLPNKVNTIRFYILKHKLSLCTSTNTPKYPHGRYSKQPLCVFLSVKCSYPSISLQEGTYLYGIHLVLVSANTLNEGLLPQMMTLQHLSQLLLRSQQSKYKWAVREKDLKLEFRLDWVKESHCEIHFVSI